MTCVMYQAAIDIILDWRCIVKGIQVVEGQGTLTEHLYINFWKWVNTYAANYTVNLFESLSVHNPGKTIFVWLASFLTFK